jgi:transmembrane sensor
VNRKYDDIEDLIGKFFSGEATPEEIASIEAWRNESASNQKQFEQYRTIFDSAKTMRSDQHFDTDAAWKQLRDKIQSKGKGRTARLRPEAAISKAFLRLAASIVILITVGFFTYRLIFPERDRVQLAAQTQVLRDTLPDGTNVVVNKQSKMSYSFNARKKEHVVKLEGEAYFTINTKKNKKFIVEAGGLTIRDIGTSFNVRAYSSSDTVEVFVQEGEVAIDRDDDNGPVHVKARESVLYVKGSNLFLPAAPVTNSIAYKTRMFDFTDQSLEEVVQSINDVYEKQLVITDSLKKCRLTVSFNNEDVNEIANVIAETLGLTIQQSGNQIKLEGKGCE